jgi:hypothetical protein
MYTVIPYAADMRGIDRDAERIVVGRGREGYG